MCYFFVIFPIGEKETSTEFINLTIKKSELINSKTLKEQSRKLSFKFILLLI